jgi:hypothetical protein
MYKLDVKFMKQPEEVGLVRSFFDKEWTLKNEREDSFNDKGFGKRGGAPGIQTKAELEQTSPSKKETAALPSLFVINEV